jgi:hypothetical protein
MGRDDEERAERVAVPDEDLTADLMEGIGAAMSGDAESRRTPGPDVEDDLHGSPDEDPPRAPREHRRL